MKKFIFFLVFISTSSRAADHIIRRFMGVRSLGMGGVRVTTGLYEDNFLGNPARVTANPDWKLDLFNITAESNPTTIAVARAFTSGGGDVLSQVAETTGKPLHARVQTHFPAFYSPGKTWSYAFGLLTNIQADTSLRKSYRVDLAGRADAAIAITLARKFFKRGPLSLGFSLHPTYRASTADDFTLTDYVQGKSLSPYHSGSDGTSIDFDLGATYRFPFKIMGAHFETGLSVGNVLGGRFHKLWPDLIKTTGTPSKQRREVGVGFALTQDRMRFLDGASFALELTDIGNNPYGSIYKLIHMGGEIQWGVFALRGGINQGYLAGGLGIDLWLMSIDFATYGEEMSLNVGQREDRRYALKVSFQI